MIASSLYRYLPTSILQYILEELIDAFYRNPYSDELLAEIYYLEDYIDERLFYEDW
jgi:hypothetical protein